MMICIPIKTKKKKKMLDDLKIAEKTGDLSELWLDEIVYLDQKFLDKIFKSAKKPILYKCSGNTEKMQQILYFKPKYIDLDVSSSNDLIKNAKSLSPKTQIILSYHNFKETPEIPALKKIASKMIKKKVDILKLATFAEDFQDSLKMMSFLSWLNKEGKKVICLCMGSKGQITRKTGHLLGNYLMYAPVKINKKTAPGQISAANLRKIQNLCP